MRRLKIVVRALVGFTVLALGVAMLVLPGPGIVTIGLGLLILSAEFAWAKRALDRLKDGGHRLRDLWK
ncbi:MAG: PGPGW domain-containing protein [Acidobacteriota bacterium]